MQALSRTFLKQQFLVIIAVLHSVVFFSEIVKAEISPDRFRVSGDLVENGDVSAGDYRVSPNGRHVVYIADQDVNNKFELYSFDIVTKDRVKLNPVMPDSRDVRTEPPSSSKEPGFIISKDSSTVFYVSDQDVDQVDRAYKVPITGGEPVRLSLIDDSQEGAEFIWEQSDSGKYVVYSNANGLHAYDTVDNTSTQIDTNFDGVEVIANYRSIRIAPDDSVVVYSSASELSFFLSYYKSPLESGAKGRISQIEGSSQPVYIERRDQDQEFIFSPDGTQLIIRGRHRDLGYAWYLASLLEVTPALQRLSPYNVDRTEYEVSSDFATMVYIVRDFVPDFSPSFNKELYSVSIENRGGWRKISRDVETSDVDFSFGISGFALSPDGTFVVYAGLEFMRTDIENSGGIYRVSISGDDYRVLSEPDRRYSRLFVGEFVGTNDRVLLSTNLTRNFESGRSLISTETGEVSELTIPSPFGGGQIRSSVLTSDNSRLIIHGDREQENSQEVYAINLDGTGRAQLNRTLRPGWDVDDFVVSPDGEYITYLADDTALNSLGLFAASTSIQPNTDELCFNLKTRNNVVALICL